MPSQNNSGLQFNKRNAITMVAMAAVVANRLMGYDGLYATSAGGVKDCQGISESDAAINDALPVVDGYSFPLECSVAIAFGDYIKPAADGSGRAAVGTIGDHCARALGAAAIGQLVEAQIVRHVHP